jgi:hypothetical protein
MQRTIDKTLRNWLTRHFLRLNILGILPSLKTIGYSSVYYNSINIQTEFPNIPMEFTVQVGTTANYYIEHSLISFLDIGKYLSLRINGSHIELNHIETYYAKGPGITLNAAVIVAVNNSVVTGETAAIVSFNVYGVELT